MRTSRNPLNRKHTPYNSFPFGRFTLADLERSIEAGLTEFRQELQKIAQQAETPTFANTIEAFERAGRSLSEATAVLNMMESALSDEAVEELAERIQPHIALTMSESLHEFPLWERVKQVAQNSSQHLSPEQQTLLNDTVETLRRSGCALDEKNKATYRQIVADITKLTGDFSRNLLHAKKDFTLHLTKKSDLKGLPTMHQKAAREAAKDAGLKGWIFTLDAPSYSPFLTYASNRSLRKRLYLAYNSLCTDSSAHSNEQVAKEILQKRQDLAHLMGYPDFATYVLKRRMDQMPQEVESFLQQLTDAYLSQARLDVKAVREEALKDGIKILQPWDFAYYMQKLRKRLFNYESEELRPYLSYENVQKGIFNLATRLYGISFKRATDISTYHKDVEVYIVRNANKTLLGLLYIDPFPRKGKQGGAWMTNLIEEYVDNSGPQRPHVAIVMNLTKPTEDHPALLTLGEVSTFLHEFGHALHGLFANTRYASLSGTNVFWDFVELPSQFMENYATEKDFLDTFAYHYETGEPLPAVLLEKVQTARQFMVAYSCVRQISFGVLDMALYHRTEQIADSLENFEHKVWKPIQLLRHPKGTCMTVQFSHIMAGGYAAGYYSYKWAEALDADTFSLFQECGLFNQTVALKFRKEILERGGTEHPMTLYQRFRGRKPTIEALLKRDGIQPKES